MLWNLADLSFGIVLRACRSAAYQMQHQQYQANNQGCMDERGGYVKCEKSQQPKNNQNSGDYSKHVFISCFFVEVRSRT
jgi:hypothetical protein